ncbi:MAG TPA: pilus assembly protein TadG-related protein [Nonomuraea sp.]|nr:pilus assembly protein TadG-related protein [Nonomuraea sp.]
MLTFLKTTVSAFRRDGRGNVAVLAAVAMPVLLGSLGIGAEVASWYSGKRAMQNAADSAAIAAATNSTAAYLNEARAVTSQYGLRHGLDGVTVTAVNNAACPAGGGNVCYRVTVTRTQPLLLAQVVGFQGDLQVDGQPAKRISATALAIRALAPREYCVLALAGSGDPEALRTNGAPKANLAGCSVMSNSNARCNGHDLGADFGDAHGTNNGCGKTRNSNIPTVTDPYSGLKSKIPADPCGGSYHAAPQKKKDPPLPSQSQLLGLLDKDSYSICGDGEALGDVLISKPNTRIVLYGGSFDLKGHKMQTMAGASVTVIFAGPTPSGFQHIFTGGGALDIQAPTTGTWKGVAMYQDPSLTSGVNISDAGNSPTWDITGLVYLPHASVTFSGAVNKSSNGHSCFVLVVDNLTVNGTANILAKGECPQAGLTMPASEVPSRGQLVS